MKIPLQTYTQQRTTCNQGLTVAMFEAKAIIQVRPILYLALIIIKFPYNTRSDWLKQRAISENRARVDDSKLAFKCLLRNFDKFDPI